MTLVRRRSHYARFCSARKQRVKCLQRALNLRMRQIAILETAIALQNAVPLRSPRSLPQFLINYTPDNG